MYIDRNTLRSGGYTSSRSVSLDAKAEWVHAYGIMEAIHQKPTTFLSYSSKDFELAEKLQGVLLNHGINVYIDRQDDSLPETPSHETARQLIDRIKEYDEFYFLCTSNSTESRWCPWEIGIATGIPKRVVVIPTKEDKRSEWLDGCEYLGLYHSLDYRDRKFLVIPPQH